MLFSPNGKHFAWINSSKCVKIVFLFSQTNNILYIFVFFFNRVVLVKIADWKTIIEADFPKASQLAYSSKGTYLLVYEPFMSNYKFYSFFLKHK